MLGEATPVQVAGFVVALRAKGEAPDEVTGLVRAMLAVASRFTVEGPAVDTCGTGGDRANTVNISTMSAMVVAGTGARVVKHGNRSASSACGSADLLEELGVVVDLEPAAAAECLDRTGVTFCFAPQVPPGAAARGDPAARARRADDLQLPRPAGQPGPAVGPGGRVRRPAAGRRDGAGAGRPRHVGAGLPRRRRAGRADADHDLAGLGGPRRRGDPGAGRARGRRPDPGRAGRAARRRPRRTTPR